jgi:hypothetical protein
LTSLIFSISTRSATTSISAWLMCSLIGESFIVLWICI